MTPSEIADWLDILSKGRYESRLVNSALKSGSEIIRKLEADLYETEGGMNVARYELDASNTKLKIATEALELAGPSLARVNRAHIARQALARINGG